MTKKNLKTLPTTSGIYLFYNSKKELIYVGKATNLKSRVRSYFSGKRTSRPIEQMIDQVKNIKTIQTDSALEAIILEGNYIKKYRPKYNIDWKDDKSWNYIVITDEKFPRVLTIRQHEADSNKHAKLMFGPYPGLKVKEMMRLLQKLFYISTCSEKNTKPCFYHQLGQCLGVCNGEISSTEYKKRVIAPLTKFLRGNKKSLIKDLEKKMKLVSKQENFEEAARLRNQIKNLNKIQDIALLNKSFVKTEIKKQGSTIRIEGYDISNLGSVHKVGSMVVFENGHSKKQDYRKFNIKKVIGQSDVDCLAEVLERRLKHPEWPYPDVILVDGGKPQVNKTKAILKQNLLKIPVVGIAKGSDRKKNEFIFARSIKSDKWVKANQKLLIQVRDEAHRFAIVFNRSKRKIK
ncbi:MAG: GIY-YIG nuclease family protein [Candidatus Magasanikbacteria bacterium]|nr:GIY-YIG nuclease family protein [Candidatus Magasanikbacteria bacterium]